MTNKYAFYAPFLLSLLVACGGSGGSENNNDTAGDSGPPPPPSGGSAAGPRSFGEPNNSQIRPGVRISSAEGSCTANFIYYTGPDDYYIGTAAHCFSQDTNSNPPVDPCIARNAALGSAVTIQNATRPGTLAYTSWQSMQDRGETIGSDICEYNDFALVKIHADDLDRVHPATLIYGGPTSLQTGTATVGTPVVSYGNSSLNGGAQTLQEKEGAITRINGSGWNYTISSDNPGVSGDSGSAVLNADNGRALGVLVTVGVSVGVGSPVTNGVMNIDMGLNYAQPEISGNLRLETWSAFSP